MPVSYNEYLFYSLCLKNKIPVVFIRQDTKLDIRGMKIKNFDFICHTKNKIYLIDVKGFSKIQGDTKVNEEDIKSMTQLQKLYGKKATSLIVFVWVDRNLKLRNDVFSQKFRIKVLEVSKYRKIKKWGGYWDRARTKKAYRFHISKLKEIWDFFPKLKPRTSHI